MRLRGERPAAQAAALDEGTGNTGYEPDYVDVSPSKTASTDTAANTGKTLAQKWAVAQALSGSKYPAIKTETEEEQQTAQNPLLRQAAPTTTSGTSNAAQEKIEAKNSDYDQKLAASEADDEAVARLVAMESYAGDNWADRQIRNIKANQSTDGDYNANVTNEKLYQYYNEWLDETDETGAQKNRQSGASGGLAGAMGGFVGSGIGAARQRAQEQAYQQAYEQAMLAEQAEAATDTETTTPAEQIAQEAQRAALTGQTAQAERTTSQTEQAAQSEERGAQETAQEAAGQADRTEINTEDTTRAKTETEDRTRANENAKTDTQIDTQQAAAENETETKAPAETRQLDTSAWDAQRKQSAARMLEAGRVSTAAVQTIVDAMPTGISAETYTTAARSVYRLARTGIAESFEDVISQARNISGVNAAQVMAVAGGENALRQAFVVGQGELQANGRERANYQAPALAQESRAGQMLNKSSTRTEAEKAFIDLTARASDIGITLEEHLKNNAMGYIEDVEIYVGDKGGAVSTTLHEALHYADSWSYETAQNLNDVTLRALAEKNGFETVERMIEAKIETYAQAGTELTWADAANELVNDAVSGAFDSEESMRELAEVMAKEAEKNAERRGAMQKVADSIRAVLDKVIEKAREILNGDRSNAAARKVMALAEAQKKAIREAFYEHLEQAGENRRAAENKNARAEEGTGEVKYQLPEMAQESEEEKAERQKQIVIRPATANEQRTSEVMQEEWSGKNTKETFDLLRPILSKFGLFNSEHKNRELNITYSYSKSNFKESVNKQSGLTPREYHDFALVQASLEEVCENAVPLEAHEDRKNRQGVEGNIVLASALQDGDRVIPIKMELKLYQHEPTALYMVVADSTAENSRAAARQTVDKEKRTGSQGAGSSISETVERPTNSSDLSIYDFYDLVKHDPNFTKYFSNEIIDEVDGKEIRRINSEMRELNKQEKLVQQEMRQQQQADDANAKEARSEGLFSEKHRAWQNSEEHQQYLQERAANKEKLESIRAQRETLGARLETLNGYAQARAAAIARDRQRAYDSKQQQSGKNREDYRRALAEEQFGTTELFEQAGYLMPDGRMLNFAQGSETRDVDHREILSAFGPTEVANGTAAMNQFIADGNVRVMAESPGVDIAAGTKPTDAQLAQIKELADEIGGAKRAFTVDFSDAKGKNVASKTYEGKVSGDRIVREIREYYETGELPAENEWSKFRWQLDDEAEADWNSYTARTAAMSMTGANAGDALGQAVSGATEAVAKTEAVTNKNVADTLAKRLIRMTASKATKADIAPRFEAILNYITQSAENGTEIDGSELVTALEDVSEAAMRDAATLNTEMWDQHKDLQSYSLWISKDSDAYPTLVREYGSWTKAQKELAKQGIYARNTRTGRDGSVYLSVNQMYQQLSNPKDGYPGMFSPEIVAESDQLERMIEVRNSIRPTMENQFDESWDESRLDFALQMAQDMLTSPAFGGTEEAAQTRKALATQIETLRANAVERTLENAERIRQRDQGDWEKQLAAQKNRDAAARKRTREANEKHLQNQREVDARYRQRTKESYQRQFEEQAAKNEGQLKRAREARENDNLRRGIARDTAALNKMLLHPAKDRYVPQALIKSVAEVAEIANGLTNNQNAREKLSALRDEIDRNGTGDTSAGGVASDWQQSGVSQMILDLMDDMVDTRNAELRKLKSRLENLDKAKETEANAQRRETLQKRIAELESPSGMARMTNSQLRQLRNIVAATVTTVRNADKLISKAKTQEAGEYAAKVAEEVRASKGASVQDGLGKDDSKVLSEMKARLKKYSTEMQDAADAKLAGDEATRAQLTEQIVEKLYVGMGIDPDADEDADRRAAVIKSVTSGVQELVDAGLGKDTKAGTTAYTNMLEALSTGDVSEAQSEIDALVKAGKSDTNIRSQLTEQYKQAYIDGTDADREEIIELLVGLKNSEGKAYYTVQDIRKWGK